jgi:hypothetical protein
LDETTSLWHPGSTHAAPAADLPDAGFSSGGIVVTPLPTQATAAVALQSDGKIVVAGASNNLLAARYNAAYGSLDTSFGNNGVAASSGVTVMTYKVAAALEPDGRIVVAGTLDHSLGFTLACFLAAGPQIGSFTANPNPVTAGSSLTLTASSITDAKANSTIAQVAFYVDSNNDGFLEPGTDTLLRRGRVIAFLEFQTAVEEIFDVQLLPGLRFPEVVGFQKETFHHTFIIPPDKRSLAGERSIVTRG